MIITMKKPWYAETKEEIEVRLRQKHPKMYEKQLKKRARRVAKKSRSLENKRKKIAEVGQKLNINFPKSE